MQHGYPSELVYIKSEGDIDLNTPLYEMGVQGIFTRSLDAALLHKKIDVAVHSMKDVPTQLPLGIIQAAVLERGPVNDLLVFKNTRAFLDHKNQSANIATSSLRRKAQRRPVPASGRAGVTTQPVPCEPKALRYSAT